MKNYRFRESNDIVTASIGYSHIGNLIKHDASGETLLNGPGPYTDCGMWTTSTPTKGEADV